MDPSDNETPQATEALTEVPIQEPTEDEGTQQTQATPGKPSRTEKRRDAWREMKDQANKADEYRAQLEAERQERQRLAEQVAELRGRTEAIQQQAQRPTGDPIKDLRDKATHTLKAMNEAKDPGTQERLLQQWYDLQDQINDVRDEQRWQKRRGEISQAMPRPASPEQRILEGEFPWMATDGAAFKIAVGIEESLWRAGKPRTIETSREALAKAAQIAGLGGHSAPSEASRRRFALPSSREGNSEGGERPTVTMNDAMKRLAEAAYPHLEAPEAHVKWATDVGQKVQKKAASQR